jgi:1,4-dihydroxy-2-naphthoate octaprenyltransferase
MTWPVVKRLAHRVNRSWMVIAILYTSTTVWWFTLLLGGLCFGLGMLYIGVMRVIERYVS